MDLAAYSFAVTVVENLEHPELVLDTRIPIGSARAFLRIRTVGPIEDPDTVCDRRHRHIRVTGHKGSGPNPMSGTRFSKKAVFKALSTFFIMGNIPYISPTVHEQAYDRYANKSAKSEDPKHDDEEKVVLRIVRDTRHQNEQSAYKMLVDEMGLKKAHKLKQIFRDARQTQQRAFRFKNTSAEDYLKEMIVRLEKAVDKGIYPPQYAHLSLENKSFLVKFLYCAPFVIDRGDGDNLCGLLISGDPNCGKTRLFKYHPAKRIANDARGVGRWDVQQNMVFLDDWKLKQIQDAENASVIRQIGVGDEAEVKIHSSSILVAPKWIASTTNDSDFTSLSDADQRRWVWLPLEPLTGPQKNYHPDKTRLTDAVRRQLKNMVLEGVPDLFQISPLCEYIDFIMGANEDALVSEASQESSDEDIIPEDLVLVKMEENTQVQDGPSTFSAAFQELGDITNYALQPSLCTDDVAEPVGAPPTSLQELNDSTQSDASHEFEDLLNML